MKIAVTGATGFVGGRLLRLAGEEQVELRALTRRPQAPLPHVEWIEGALEDRDALARLCEGSDAVIHIAGTISAPDRESFMRGNAEGTAALLAAAEQGGSDRFVHVSSLAAREPGLSLYGESKAVSEQLVEASSLPSVIVRPPAVYGPGDRETLELFRMARRGLVLMPPEGRASYIHADDLSRLLLSLAASGTPRGEIYEPDDNRDNGWGHREFAQALGKAVGRTPLILNMPSAALRGAAMVDRMVRRGAAKLTPDRAAYFCHPDWTVRAEKRPPATLWSPSIDTPTGLASTARWYLDKGWL
ncbi:NAD-dependent epimerase/dehydratase family protein [Sphingomicrobium lutaoense]|uniref:Nucleoside-diphosphate-sugar epimerase n=1 Tax=Sphingomicrobium lutaoense TaxID=515949 RepID=A0A839YS69_9SPHN|nr:NAD-dependent epimerase/dehydratase family protein [Sphingomicrobium lutaoense]MBB3763131.1 nucleoside-diphosphate-sugar epimerase [Sphingomicrobium lutaoense]